MSEKNSIIHECYEERLKHCCYNRIHYFINAEKKTIVCKIEPYPTVPHFCECKLGFGQQINRDFVEYCVDEGLSFVGKAICTEPDVFDVEFGKKIAYDKAIMKLFDVKAKFFNEAINEFQNCIDILHEEIEKTARHKTRALERFEAKMKEVN